MLNWLQHTAYRYVSFIVTLGNDEYFIKLIVGNNRRIKFSSKVL